VNKITLDAKGKINLLLDVTAKRENGYHDIVTIMQSVKLSDRVTVEKTDDGLITLQTNFDDCVAPRDNIVYKALELMKNEFSLTCGFKASIGKNIPIAGGMGGGSTDAAAAIKAVNIICGLSQSTESLMRIGLKLGADVPFCIYEKCALARGIGEELCSAEGLRDVKIVIVNPKISVSTKQIYELVDKKCAFKTIDEQFALKTLESKDFGSFEFALKNIMQSVTGEICPEINGIIDDLKELGAIHSMMSGSGPTCFGIFKKDFDEEKIKNHFKNYFVAVTEPI